MGEKSIDLVGRSAIVTGASQGLGRAIAARLLEAGASVLLVARGRQALDRTREELGPLATRRGQVLGSLCADVSTHEACAAIVEHARKTLPDLTVLVNNAGVYGPIGPLEDVAWDEWEAALRINLVG